MNAFIPEHFPAYLLSLWGILTNILIILVFGLAAYNCYAKRWSAKTGRYFTEGRVTFTQIVSTKMGRYAEISYAYNVDGVPYNGSITSQRWKLQATLDANPKGKNLRVYYSRKDPSYSQANRPPTHMEIAGATALNFFLIPLLLLNIVSFYLYWLINVPH